VEMNDEPDSSIKQQSFVIRPKNSFTENRDDPDETLRDISATVAHDASFFSRNSASSCIMQIKTIRDSVIAGRTLYLSTRQDHNPEQLRQAIVSSLCEAVSSARKKALVLSNFQKSQEQVRSVQGSLVFQMAMASLIMLVSAAMMRSYVQHHKSPVRAVDGASDDRFSHSQLHSSPRTQQRHTAATAAARPKAPGSHSSTPDLATLVDLLRRKLTRRCGLHEQRPWSEASTRAGRRRRGSGAAHACGGPPKARPRPATAGLRADTPSCARNARRRAAGRSLLTA
jgi:hypothetical protein